MKRVYAYSVSRRNKPNLDKILPAQKAFQQLRQGRAVMKFRVTRGHFDGPEETLLIETDMNPSVMHEIIAQVDLDLGLNQDSYWMANTPLDRFSRVGTHMVVHEVKKLKADAFSGRGKLLKVSPKDQIDAFYTDYGEFRVQGILD